MALTLITVRKRNKNKEVQASYCQKSRKRDSNKNIEKTTKACVLPKMAHAAINNNLLKYIYYGSIQQL